MALTEVTISFDLNQILGGDFETKGVGGYVTTNVTSGTLMDTSTGETRLGDQTVAINSDGTGSFTTWAIGADGNPVSWQTSLVISYRRPSVKGARATRTFGPYTIEAANDGDNITDLEDEQAIPAEYQTAFTEAAQAYLDAQAAIAGIDDTDSAVAGLIEDELVGPLTNAALNAGYTQRSLRPIYLRDYEGAGEGDVDVDTAAFLDAAATAEATGRPIRLTTGQWRIDTAAVIETSGVQIIGDGSDSTEILVDAEIGPLSFQGSIPALGSPTTTLASDATVTDGAASNTIEVASAAGLAAGDLILIGDNYTIPGAATIHATWVSRERGELQRIKSIAGTTITLAGNLRDDYTTARSATVHKLTPISGVGVKGVTIRNIAARPTTTTFSRMLQFFCCTDVVVDDVRFIDGDHTGLSLDYVYNAAVTRVSGEGFADDNANNKNGYVINIGPCENVRISDSVFGKCRHGITTDGWPDHRGWPRNVLVSDCQAIGTTAAAFDTHPWGSDITFADCDARGCFRGFQIRTKRTKVITSGTDRAQAGDVHISGGTAFDVEVFGGVFRKGRGEGVSFEGNADLGYPSRITISDAIFEETYNRAVRVGLPIDDLLVKNITAIRPSRVGPTGVTGAILIEDSVAPARFMAIDNIGIGSNYVVSIGSSVTGARLIGNKGFQLQGSGAAVIRGTGTGTASNRLRDNYDLTADLTFSDSEYFIANSRARFGYDGTGGKIVLEENGGTQREFVYRAGGTEKLTLGTDGSLRLNTASKGGGAGSLIALTNVTTAPTSNPTGGGVLWFESGTLRHRTSAGTIATVSGDVVAKSADYTLTAADKVCLGTGGVSGITITLPAATQGAEYVVKKVDAGAGAVTVATTSSQTIDGATTKVLSAQYASVRVVSDGTAWHTVAAV